MTQEAEVAANATAILPAETNHEEPTATDQQISVEPTIEAIIC